MARRSLVLSALLLIVPLSARAEDVVPRLSALPIEDVPSTRPNPFPAFGNFAWRAFVALNWPAASDGAPDLTRQLSDAGPRTWERFSPRYAAFPDAGHADGPCGVTGRTVSAYEPFAEFNQTSFISGRFEPPLVAANRTHVRYEVRLNPTALNALIGFRQGALFRAPAGSVSVKAAWRLLTAADPPALHSRYYVVRAAVTDIAATLAAGKVECETRDLALVCFHIVIRTPYRPQGIWATFEHVDVAPPGAIGESSAGGAGPPLPFVPGSAAGEASPPPGAAAASLTHPPEIDPEPTPVARRHPIHPELMAINRAYWALPGLAGTIWANYMLVAVQWPTLPLPVSPDNDGRYFPGLRLDPNTPGEPYQASDDGADYNLVNVTMETFEQDPPSSCMACHHAVSNALGRDFVGIIPPGGE